MPFNLIVIGGSTGGPILLRRLFRSLPSINAAVLVVQHMPKYINESLTNSLGSLSTMPVKIAEDKEFLKQGTIYLAPSEIHLRLIRNKQVSLFDSEKVNLSKPSIDVTMESLKEDSSTNITGILFPGMGDDGIEGLHHIKNINGTTYAIDDYRKALKQTLEKAKEKNVLDRILTVDTARDVIYKAFSEQKSISYKEYNSASRKVHQATPHQHGQMPENDYRKLIIIGSSTGGPRILKRVFKDLPRLNVPIVLIQHMPEFINRSFKFSLDNLTDMDVTIANDGEILVGGKVYIAPSNIHLTLESNNTMIKLVQGEKVNFCRPAIDVAMKSLRKVPSQSILGVVLTGMGRDGADGLSYIKKELQGITISEDEESCIVYGMPKAAVETGDVDFVLNPEEVREKLISFGK